MNSEVEFIDIDWENRPYRIEYQWVGNASSAKPLIVFLHEGLGSLAMWKGFPERLCHAVNCRGLVYSRPGYGQSIPRDSGGKWGVDLIIPVVSLDLEYDTSAPGFPQDNGTGLGMMWGREQAEEMLKEAGFEHIEVIEMENDSFNLHYLCKVPS